MEQDKSNASTDSLQAVIKELKQQLSEAQATITQLNHQHEVAEQNQAKVQGQLEASRHLLQLVMDTLPESIFWKDCESRYLGCNHHFANDAGFENITEIIGKDDHDMPWTAEESEFYRSCDRRVIESNQAELGIVETQLRADGKQIWLETNKVPLRNQKGQVIGILGTYQDITERKETETALQAFNEKLATQTEALTTALEQLQHSQIELVQREKMSTLGNLVAGVAHEINNPVGFLVGNLEPAKDYIADLFELIEAYQEALPKPDTKIEQLIETIELDYVQQDLPKLLESMGEGVNRIRNISESLRVFSRADTVKPVAFDIHTGLDSSLLILAHRLRADGDRPEIAVTKNYGQLPSVKCFAGQLNQVFMNLLANAIDALEEASLDQRLAAAANTSLDRVIVISTCLDETKQWAEIVITDNGVGMDTVTKAKIFNDSFTTKAVGKGTGLGLAIAQQIIEEKHGGTIQVNSAQGEGTSFLMKIPIAGPIANEN
ncbi:MAG: ATP-binding protein [Limnothrix sp.]